MFFGGDSSYLSGPPDPNVIGNLRRGTQRALHSPVVLKGRVAPKCRYLRRCRRRPPNAKSPAARVSKVEGSGTVACRVVFGSLKVVESTITLKPSWTNVPGTNVGAEVVPVYIWGPSVANPSEHVAKVVPSKQIANPPSFVPLKNRIKVGVIATGAPPRE